MLIPDVTVWVVVYTNPENKDSFKSSLRPLKDVKYRKQIAFTTKKNAEYYKKRHLTNYAYKVICAKANVIEILSIYCKNDAVVCNKIKLMPEW